jgi:hypothetical protein
MGSSLPVEGATNRDVFEAYVERVLSPELRPGQVVVMDNLTTHKGERVRELIEGRGCEMARRHVPTGPGTLGRPAVSRGIMRRQRGVACRGCRAYRDGAM